MVGERAATDGTGGGCDWCFDEMNQVKDKLFGGTNPFCNMTIGSSSFVSKIKKGTRNPRWEGESFTFPDVNPTVESQIFINVMHKGGKLRPTRKIGGMSVRAAPRLHREDLAALA